MLKLGVNIDHVVTLRQARYARTPGVLQEEPSVLAAARECRGKVAVFCSHGDVIPDVLDALLRDGLKLKDELRWQKASTWVLSWDGDRPTKGSYLPPPR